MSVYIIISTCQKTFARNYCPVNKFLHRLTIIIISYGMSVDDQGSQLTTSSKGVMGQTNRLHDNN